jgi:flagellar basal body-associated protein FliL
MNKRLLIIIIVAAVIVMGGVIYYFVTLSKADSPVTNFQQCVATGQPVRESYPRQCNYKGHHFVEVIHEPN